MKLKLLIRMSKKLSEILRKKKEKSKGRKKNNTRSLIKTLSYLEQFGQ